MSLLFVSRVFYRHRRGTRNYAAPSGYFERPHMNELPVPSAPWGVWYPKKQAMFNAILVAGILTFMGSAGVAFSTGAMYLNWAPPCRPGPPVHIEVPEEPDELGELPIC